jgi:regulatory helix-turn-helix LysR family protein
MADRLQELNAFVRTAETGSFSRVARELGVSQPSVSRLVANLEARLGVTLLLRTTRRVTPTEAGSAFLERARRILGRRPGRRRSRHRATTRSAGGLGVRRPPAGQSSAPGGGRAGLPGASRHSENRCRAIEPRLHPGSWSLGSNRVALRSGWRADVVPRRRSGTGRDCRRCDRMCESRARNCGGFAMDVQGRARCRPASPHSDGLPIGVGRASRALPWRATTLRQGPHVLRLPCRPTHS